VRSFYLYLQFAHDDYLQAGVERGAAGAAALLLLLPGAVAAGWRRPAAGDPLRAALAPAAAAALAAVLVQALVDFPLQIPAVALSAAVLAGLAWSAALPPRPAPPCP
jgi:O-antigen ligase